MAFVSLYRLARCQDDADGDIDFLVEMEPGRSQYDLGGLLGATSQRKS